MSTAINDLHAQEHQKIREAVANNDHVTLYFMANIAQGEDEVEQAQYLLKLARTAQANDHEAYFGYDEMRDNELD